MTDKEIYELDIIRKLLEGKEPLTKDYEGDDGLQKGGFIELVNDMQNRGLIEGVVFAKGAENPRLIPFLNTAEVTDYGKQYFYNKIGKL